MNLGSNIKHCQDKNKKKYPVLRRLQKKRFDKNQKNGTESNEEEAFDKRQEMQNMIRIN